MFSEKYLISAPYMKRAEDVAKKTGLERSDWVYVPTRDDRWRRQVLEGRMVSSIEHLIGEFSSVEMAYLLRKRDEVNAV